jgi:hypothetical protein
MKVGRRRKNMEDSETYGMDGIRDTPMAKTELCVTGHNIDHGARITNGLNHCGNTTPGPGDINRHFQKHWYGSREWGSL